MVFSSTVFLLYFFPAFILCYFLLPIRFKNTFLLASSIAFYAWGAPLFIFAILATTVVDFYFVQRMYHASSEKKRKLFLAFSLSLNLGMLFYFKYCNFFIENVNLLFTSIGWKEMEWVNVLLPIGISFYTFESLTYVIDVYRRVHKPLNNFWEYQLYIILFPKLIAGPIIRYHEIADQINGRFAEDSTENKIQGFYRFCIGLAKKVLLANVLAVKADEIFNLNVTELSTPMAWIGMLAYTFQIYFDFSGYSDMAIGIGKMLGFTFPENFNNPYTSGSFTEFWRRWHMTLGNWMRNYLYIPLGGNRVNNKARVYFNLWLVFLASGFWHGAAWTFIIWGVYHGIWLVMERMFLLKCYAYTGKFVSMLITFLFVAIGWVFFRAADSHIAFEFVKKLFTFQDMNVIGHVDYYLIFTFSLAAFFSFFTALPKGRQIQHYWYFSKLSSTQAILFAFLLIPIYFICIAAINSGNLNPFIYFRF